MKMIKKMTFPLNLYTTYFVCFFPFFIIGTFQCLANEASDTTLANQYFATAKAKVDLSQLDSAILYYKKSAKIYREYRLHENHAASLNSIGEQYFYLGQLDQAIDFVHQALQVALSYDLAHQSGKSYNSIAAIYSQKGMPDSATIYFEKALEKWLPLDGEQHLRIVVIYTNLAAMYNGLGDYQKSSEYSNRAINILKLLNDDADEYLAYNYNTLGAISVAKGLYPEAIEYITNAMQIWLEKFGEAHLGVASFRMNIGEIYRRNGDFEKALLYYNKALSVFDQLGIEVHQVVASCYTNIGSVYHETHEYDKALNTFYKAKEIWTAFGDQLYSLATLNNNISQVFFYTHRYDTATIYLQKAIEILENGLPTTHPDLGLYYLNLGKCYFLKREFEKAKNYYDVAMELMITSNGEKHPDLSALYRFYGQLFLVQHQNHKAIEYFQKAIIANVQDFNNVDIFVNPELENILSKTYLLSILEEKANAFHELFNEKPDSLLFLETALKTGELAIQLLDKIRMDYKSEGSKLFLNKEFASIFKSTLNYAIELYQISRDNVYFQQAFNIAERSKSAVLFATIFELDAKTIGGIPDSLQKTARLLKHDIDFYNQKIKEENGKENPDIVKRDKWQNIVYASVNAYDELIVSFEKNYPDYYDLKYSFNVADVNDIQTNLRYDEVLIEYVMTDTVMIVFYLTKNSADYFSVPIDSNFTKQIDDFREIITSKNFTDELANRYNELAYQLYLKLIAPLEELHKGMTLIIIPDGKLATIPFEAFLTSPRQGNDNNIADYPYLVKQHPVSYGYSSTILLNSLHRKNHAQHNSILSFAPSFRNDDEMLLAESKERGGEFVSLPGTKEEITQILDIAGGESYLDENASEAIFKKFAHGYQVLHIATHGIFDDLNPMRSSLVFSNATDTVEDGYLNVYELYNLTLNADMAVLSACNSGYGKLQEGEGVMSMARAFQYAGVPGIVMTQWNVNDKSSTKIMVSFYEHLHSGLSKAQALQKAKLDYLKNADKLTSNPYFWAGFVVIGNHLPVDFSNTFWYWWLLIIPVFFMGGLFIRKKFYSSKSVD
jgi:CHAT domain-containing protein/Tfp pilus assembly protein PilF